jgi:hypothetical protein
MTCCYPSQKQVKVIYFNGKTESKLPTTLNNIEQISTGYFEKNQNIAFKIYSVGQIFSGRGNKWKIDYQKRQAYDSLKKYKSKIQECDLFYADI